VHGGADGIEAPFYLNTAGHPVVLDEIVLAAALLEGSPKAKLDTTRDSMHCFFGTPFGVRILKAQEKPDVEARLSLPRALVSRRGMPV
jgi:hypothetical protein